MQRDEGQSRDVVTASERGKGNRRRHGKAPSVQRETQPRRGVRTGTRTGTTQHFSAWMADLQAKSALQKMKLNQIADSVGDQKVAAAFALLYVGGIKNVWQLTQAKFADLMAVNGIGVKRLDLVAGYLKSKSVKCGWAEED